MYICSSSRMVSPTLRRENDVWNSRIKGRNIPTSQKQELHIFHIFVSAGVSTCTYVNWIKWPSSCLSYIGTSSINIPPRPPLFITDTQEFSQKIFLKVKTLAEPPRPPPKFSQKVLTFKRNHLRTPLWRFYLNCGFTKHFFC